MNFLETDIKGVFIIEPKVYSDSRGYFMESYKQVEFEKHVGKINFVQDNESKSSYGVLRGLHYQLPPYAQAKLTKVTKGKVLDVAIDMRKSSPTFAKHVAVELSEDNKRQLFIPRGFAHGFLVLSNDAIFTYKVDNIYAPKSEGSVLYNDPTINIDWVVPVKDILLSQKDAIAPLLQNAILFD